PLARRDAEAAERLGLVRFAVAEERPHAGLRGIRDATMEQVAIEARLVDGMERPEPHAHRRKFPEAGHEARMRIRREALPPLDLAAEPLQLSDAQPAFEERARVHTRRRVPLEVDLIAAARAVAPAEEVIESHLDEARAR